MLKNYRLLTITILFALNWPVTFLMSAPSPPADMILWNGKILTVDSEFSIEQALAISAGQFVHIGSNREVLALKGSDTKIIDLNGHTVIPGLIDNHYHMLSKAVDQHLGVEIALTESLEEMLKSIAAKSNKTPPGDVVYTTSGWMIEQLREKRAPSRQELDRASPGNPVVVQGGHTLYLNSQALKLAGIDRHTPHPPGGFIGRDIDGIPTGLLIDNAMFLARGLIPTPTFEQKLDALRIAQKKENSVGITSVREPGLHPEDMRVYQRLWQEEELTLRISMNLNLDHHLSTQELTDYLSQWGVSTRFGDPMLRLDGIGEFGLDGGFEAAWMSQPYFFSEAPSPFHGLQRIDSEKFSAVIKAANTLGWRPSIHAVGDKAIDMLLDIYKQAHKTDSISGKRWLIEHAHYTRLDQIPSIRDLQVLISTQFHPYMSAGTMKRHWGEERAAQTMRLRDWIDGGLTVGGGSDWSLVPANPFWMIYFWVTRDTRLWGKLGPEQSITREEALRVMTINNAHLTFEETIKGSIEVGKLADLVILSEDLMTIPEAAIRDIKALCTMLEGEIVYVHSDSPISID